MRNLGNHLSKDGSSQPERLQRDCVIASRVLAQYVYPQAYMRAAGVVGQFLEGFMQRRKLFCHFNDFGRRVLKKYAGRLKSYLQNIRLYKHGLKHAFYKVYKIQNKIDRTMFRMVPKQVMDKMVVSYVQLRKEIYCAKLKDWYGKYFEGTKVGDLDNWINGNKEPCPNMFVVDTDDIIKYIKLHNGTDEIKAPQRKVTRTKAKKTPTSKGSIRITVANKNQGSTNFKRSFTKIPGRGTPKVSVSSEKGALLPNNTKKGGEPGFN